MAGMIRYPPDMSKPYTIISLNDDGTYTISGTEKTIVAHMGDEPVNFGGNNSIFIVKKEQFLTYAQKKKLRWVKRHLGDKQHDLLQKEIYGAAIAAHTIIEDT